jgi:hypothetical protein
VDYSVFLGQPTLQLGEFLISFLSKIILSCLLKYLYWGKFKFHNWLLDSALSEGEGVIQTVGADGLVTGGLNEGAWGKYK